MHECGAWPSHGGCVLTAGHNRGKADVPAAHVFLVDEACRTRFYRQVATLPRPRVSWCRLTRRWLMSPSGVRHVCGRNSPLLDEWRAGEEAFRYQWDAMDEAARWYRDRWLSQVGPLVVRG